MSTSRKKRKRYRARERSALEATASLEPRAIESKPWGLLGESAELTRGDLALIGHAVNQDWDVPRVVRHQLTRAILERLGPATPCDAREVRWQLAAARVLMQMNGANIRILKRALQAAAAIRRTPLEHSLTATDSQH